MRLWLKDSERRPDPAPVETDDRKAFLTGIAAWAVALVLLFVFIGPVTSAGNAWWLWACAAGIVIGVVGIFYAQWHRKHN